jgi:exodeoxyribonuclease VII large subunit
MNYQSAQLDQELSFGVSEFVAVFNQTLENVYPSVTIVGELANFKVSKNRWVYFDLKDDVATVHFFGSVYNLPGPLENGMLLKVKGMPRLHQAYGFSINVQSIGLVGEGTIKRTAELLAAKLAAEGLFDESRKRPLPYPPKRIGLITSKESAAYADFIKIINARWRGVLIELADVLVQGDDSPGHIVEAINSFNQIADPPEVLVLIRGGGSPEDLAAFSAETVTRAVALSRIPTLVAIGHEVDVSLAELAADQRASTPSNAAEILVPDRQQVAAILKDYRKQLGYLIENGIKKSASELANVRREIALELGNFLEDRQQKINVYKNLLAAFNPNSILNRGYSIVRKKGQVVRLASDLSLDDIVNIQFTDASSEAKIIKVDEV